MRILSHKSTDHGSFLHKALFSPHVSHKTATPIQKEDLSDVYAYMSGVFHRYNITPLSIGGVGDHVHAILQFKESVIDFATVIRDVKTASNYGAENEAYKLGVCEMRRIAFCVSAL